DGADAGVEVIFKANTDGGIKAIVLMVDLVRDRINSGQHDGKIVPIVLLEKDSYQHSQHGRVWIPVLNTVDWMSLDGPAPTPAPRCAAVWCRPTGVRGCFGERGWPRGSLACLSKLREPRCSVPAISRGLISRSMAACSI